MADTSDDRRPSPDAMLKLAQEEEAAAGSGKLRIFLGYAAGVGKTYAMLEAARQRHAEGRDTVVAYVESHGRAETDALLTGLELIPRRQLFYQGVGLEELDLDAVLTRKPQIALVDELAHTNAPGSRHEKRWQDVEEILAAGIDVYTTLNVQHFESLNDTVAQITGIVVKETVPDGLLDRAAEIRLVDISPDDLLQRLREGKIYIPAQAALASTRFFSPGNLLALRELSLRRAASRVDDQMRAYREARSIPAVWAATERLLVCVSGSPYSERLIRSTRRLADELKAPWYTVYIETPSTSKFASQNRAQVWRDLRLAESLGSQTATVSAYSVPEATIEYAVRHNVTKIVVGKPNKRRWREFFIPPIVDRLIQLSGNIDICVVSIEHREGRHPQPPATKEPQPPFDIFGYLASLALVAIATGLCHLFRPFLGQTNMVMLYLLAVVLAASRLGLGPAIGTASLGVLTFDFFFVPPFYSFNVSDNQYLLTFLGLFTVGVVISSLVAKDQARTNAVREREVQTNRLYSLSRDLAAGFDLETIQTGVVRDIGEALNAQVALFLPEGDKLEIKAASPEFTLDPKELAVADWAFRNRQAAGQGTNTLISAQLLYLPLPAASATLGVLGVKLATAEEYTSQPARRLLDAFAIQTAMAVERVILARQSHQNQIIQARENLERALLKSISHDLRPPLAALGEVFELAASAGMEMAPSARRELLATARAEAERLHRLMDNLEDTTRLATGEVVAKKSPHPVAELIDRALTTFGPRLYRREVAIQLAPELGLVPMDLHLMTKVLVNLLDNALKYSPYHSTIRIAASSTADWLTIEVADQGPGVPEQELKRYFDKFYRTPITEGAWRTGLGLFISRGFVEANGGRIHAKNGQEGGLRVIIQLPLTPEN